MNPKDCIAGDTETGGIYPSIHALLSVAFVASWMPDKPLVIYIKPDPEKRVDAEAAKLNGYDWRLWNDRGAVALGNAMDELDAWLKARLAEKKEARLIAHNAGFDRSFLEEGYRMCGKDSPPGRHSWRCSMSCFGELMDEGLLPHGSASLARLGELSGQWPAGGRPQLHDVAEDALACLRGYQWLQTVRPALNPTVKVLRHHSEAMEAAESALEGLMPFVVPGLAAPPSDAYTAAVEGAGRVLGLRPAQLAARFATPPELFPR